VSSPCLIQELTIEEVADWLERLRDLYDRAYYSSHMFEDVQKDIEKKPELFRMFIALDRDKAVGARAIELKTDMQTTYPGLDYLGLEPVWGKRFAVLPEYRGLGIGKQILETSNKYCFSELNLKALFGSSAEIGALSMYGRAGALYLKETITSYSHKNTPEDNLLYFKEFIANPFFRNYRLPNHSKQDIRFAYAADENTRTLFKENGYITHADLLELTNCTKSES